MKKIKERIENNTCQNEMHHVYLMSVFREWYALLKDTAIRKSVGISMVLPSKRDAMKREVTELSDNSCGELSVHRNGRRDGRSFFYGLKTRNTRQSVKRKSLVQK